jgi:hypothetical protein
MGHQFLYTLTVSDAAKASKLEQALPSTLQKVTL